MITLKNTRHGSLSGNGGGGFCMTAIGHPSPGSFIMYQKHKLSKHPLYQKYHYIKKRCDNPKSDGYKYYGERGITIYKQWRDNFISFYEYVMALPNAMKPGYSIDRIDNNGNYEPCNIRWVEHYIQTANRRKQKSNKSGYSGIYRKCNRWYSDITTNRERVYLGYFDKIKDAVEARNKYIRENNLSHPIQ